MRECAGGKVLVRRISRRMFFGFGMLKYFGCWIAVSDIEKTLIDFVYFREPLMQETLKEIRRRMDKEKLNGYLKWCPGWVRKRVRTLLAGAAKPQIPHPGIPRLQ
jgi:hypothetical protein